MKISNMLQYTEKHRFCVFRDFAISPLQHKMLSSVYQPMIGGLAVSFYFTLYGMLPPDRAGYSTLEQQRKLFLSLDLEQGERGRLGLMELASKLEAVGLLQTVRRQDPFEEDYMYEYLLHMPLSPNEFFQTDHLIWLLHDRVGKHLLAKIREEVWSAEPKWHSDSNEPEDITSAFFDLFRISPYTVDTDMERMMQEAGAAQETTVRDTLTDDKERYTLDQILLGIPHFSENRKSVESLSEKPEQLYLLNFVAAKYGLDLTDLRWILDSSNLFDESGCLHKQLLEEEAKLIYLQREKRSDRRAVLSGRKDELHEQQQAGTGDTLAMNNQVDDHYFLEVPVLLQSQYSDVRQYNLLLRNLPYTKVLEMHFPTGVTPDVREAFLELNSLYKLPDAVINVLMHFISIDERLWERFPIKNIATDMIGKQKDDSFESAVEYVRKRIKSRQQATASAREASARAAAGRPRGGSNTRTGSAPRTGQKPHIPIIKQSGGASVKLTEAELEEMRQLARELDDKFR